MPKIKISKSTVDAVRPSLREEVYWDDRLPGFGLKVTPAGAKVYLYRYRIAPSGQAYKTAPQKITIGRHGPLTPDQARHQARELAGLVAKGADPRELAVAALEAKDAASRDAERRLRLENELAFSRIADLWVQTLEQDRSEATARDAANYVRTHLKPALGDRPLPHIGRPDLLAMIDRIPAAKRATRRNVFAYGSSLFGWAVKRGHIDINPFLTLPKPPEPKARDRILADDELIHLWRASTGLRGPMGPFYRLAILTGQRREEIASLRWQELDCRSRTWTIPAERTKNGIPHLVPLSPPVVAELDALAGRTDWPASGYVLTTTGSGPINGFSKAKLEIDAVVAKESAALEPWRVHDLRRTVITGLQRLGVRFEVTEAVVNHISGAKSGVAGVYQRHDWKAEKRAALDAWAAHVGQILKGADRSNVIQLADARA